MSTGISTGLSSWRLARLPAYCTAFSAAIGCIALLILVGFGCKRDETTTTPPPPQPFAAPAELAEALRIPQKFNLKPYIPADRTSLDEKSQKALKNFEWIQENDKQPWASELVVLKDDRSDTVWHLELAYTKTLRFTVRTIVGLTSGPLTTVTDAQGGAPVELQLTVAPEGGTPRPATAAELKRALASPESTEATARKILVAGVTEEVTKVNEVPVSNLTTQQQTLVNYMVFADKLSKVTTLPSPAPADPNPNIDSFTIQFSGPPYAVTLKPNGSSWTITEIHSTAGQ